MLKIFTAASKHCASPRMKQKNTSDVNGPMTPSGGSFGLHDACYGLVTKGDRAVNRDFCLCEGNSPLASLS